MRLNYKMEMKKEFRNELLNRRELVFDVEQESNPSFEEVRKLIASEKGVSEENVDVKKVEGSFGKKSFEIDVYIYDSKEDLDSAKKMESTSKQRKEEAKAKIEARKSGGVVEGSEESAEGSDSAPIEEKSEETNESAEEKPVEAPVSERPEEESKAAKEEAQAKEESKE